MIRSIGGIGFSLFEVGSSSFEEAADAAPSEDAYAAQVDSEGPEKYDGTRCRRSAHFAGKFTRTASVACNFPTEVNSPDVVGIDGSRAAAAARHVIVQFRKARYYECETANGKTL